MTLAPQIAAISFDAFGAAAATGVSVDVIRRAMRSGDLPTRYPKIDGRQVAKPLIPAKDLLAWVERGDTDRKTA